MVDKHLSTQRYRQLNWLMRSTCARSKIGWQALGPWHTSWQLHSKTPLGPTVSTLTGIQRLTSSWKTVLVIQSQRVFLDDSIGFQVHGYRYNAGQCIITTLLRAHHVSVECISALASLAIAMPLQTMYTFEKKTASAMSCFLCPRACSSPFVVAAYDNINVSAGKSVVRESGRRSKDDFNGMIASIRGSNYSVTDFQQPLPMCLERDSSRIMSLSELLTPPPAASRRLEEAVVQTILSRAQGMFGLSLDQDDFRSAFDHVFHPSHHHALNHPQPFTMFLTDLDETNKVDHVEMLSLIEAGAVKLGIQLGILEAAPTHLNARDEADDPAHAAAALLRKGNPPPGSETHLQRSHHAISPLRTYRIALSGDELTIRLVATIDTRVGVFAHRSRL
eukprot:m.225791 g.225791  ORF g.225791 m.225791 type:complete len:391 (-) comp17311_c0_seq19:3000-4172(-)